MNSRSIVPTYAPSARTPPHRSPQTHTPSWKQNATSTTPPPKMRRTCHPSPAHRPHRMCRVISTRSPLKTKAAPSWHQTSSCTDTTELSRTPCPAATASHTRHASCLARTALRRNRTPPHATPALCRKHSQCRVTLAVLDSRRTRSRVTPVPRSRSPLSLARTARRPPPSTPPPHNRAATSLVLQDRLRL